MSDEADVLRKLEKLSLDTVAQGLRALHDAARGDAPRSARGGGHDDAARDVVFDVARLVLNVYEQFLRLQERYHDVIADGLRDIGSYYRSGVSRERLRIPARMGQRATERFQIENDESEDMELTFRVGEFVGDDERFTPAVTIGPPGHEVVHAADRRVASGERRTFEVAVPVENPFRPGRRYAGTIFVVREGRTVGELTVEVTVEGARRP